MYLRLKRLLDFLVSLIFILAIAIVLIPIIILLKMTGEGHVFYYQKRLGRNQREFEIIKFATMLKDSLNMGMGATTVRNDPRITPVGKYLRMSKLNEIPQIFNVLKGDMSFVGPRPLLEKSYRKYSPEVQDVIYNNRPGITGLGSVVFRDEEKLVSSVMDLGEDTMEYYKKYIYPYKGALELYYYHHISFWTDVKILFATAWQIIFSGSDLIYRFFPDLPPKPRSLTVAGISQIYQK